MSVFDLLGVASYAVDWQNDLVDLPGTALQPGTTWIFQGWYRDVDPAGIPSQLLGRGRGDVLPLR